MSQDQSLRLIEPTELLEQHLRIMQDAVNIEPFMPYDERIRHLRALRKLLVVHQLEIAQAINKDFGNRPEQETKLAEIYGSVSNIDDAVRHLKKWMKPQRRSTGIWFKPGKSRVIPQPKGVVGIVTPWNYPIFLSFGPLTSAIAAGNRCMLKMASNSEHLKNVLEPLFKRYFSEDVIAFLPNASARVFSALPFDHLIFTGSAITGKQVMSAAANNLTPVTLELGGKSPTIIDKDFSTKLALKRILFLKYLNAGQTCISPDYLFVHSSKAEEVIRTAQKIMKKRYSSIRDPNYTSIIDEKAFLRLQAYVHEAEGKGCDVHDLLTGERFDESARKFMPMFVEAETDDDLALLNEEIFGPIMPIITYDSIDEVLDYINARQRPLALYLYSNDKALVDKVLYSTLSGGVSINDCGLHVLQHDMPFGGVGHSGMGQYHGYEGFLEFTKLRPVFYQSRFAQTRLLYPPYGTFFNKIYNMMVR
jgi:coniferyl-aldehyde dehydrogenase